MRSPISLGTCIQDWEFDNVRVTSYMSYYYPMIAEAGESALRIVHNLIGWMKKIEQWEGECHKEPEFGKNTEVLPISIRIEN